MGERERLANRRGHEVVGFVHGAFRYTGGVGRFDDGRVAEVFLNVVGNAGTAIETTARGSAIVASVAFWFGVPATVQVEQRAERSLRAAIRVPGQRTPEQSPTALSVNGAARAMRGTAGAPAGFELK